MRAWIRLLGVLSLGCDAEPESGAVGGTDTDAEVEASTGAQVLRECIAPQGMGRPTTIEDAVDLINALPKPTTLPCFLESLDRPLGVIATESRSSAQPSTGPENPRLFITADALILSVLPEGLGSDKLEFAYDVGDRLSVKAELTFPVEESLDYAAPYAEVRRAVGTSCGSCHLREQHWDTVDDVAIFASDALQFPSEMGISASYVGALAGACDSSLSPQRCAMLSAIFGHGDVVAEPLPELLKICRLVE